jgi:hypothetical protein
MKLYEYRYDFVENKLKENVVYIERISHDYIFSDVLFKDKTGDEKIMSTFNYIYFFHPRYKQIFSFSKLKDCEKIKLINNMLKR